MFTQARFFRFMIACCVVGLLCLVYGFLVEPKTLKIRHVEIVSENWHGVPIKIGLMSDIHIGGVHVSAPRIALIAKRMNAQAPDIILLAGDYVNGHVSAVRHKAKFNAEIKQGLQNLGELHAPLGVYAVMGNHDAWYSNDIIRDTLKSVNVRVLENENIHLPSNLDICLVGLADSDTGVRDGRAFFSCEASSSVIAFMHSPDSFGLMPSHTALAMAGHTHGGQINIPLIGRRVTATKIGPQYAYGTNHYWKIPTFVTAGIGTSMLPARFRAPPEIVIITLRGTSH
ncbi:MAG: hypothetical protein COA43_12035 [Robiginitomaculum sp.]|nr:MAG: hypothetical protein COA43_12035 [Robiginitomaculum sp.]